MAIKAIGKIIENSGDGRKIKVDWIPIFPTKEWYFYTNRCIIWRVVPNSAKKENLIAFTFDNKEQDIGLFFSQNVASNRSVSMTDERFKWTGFYEELADKLLPFRNNRTELVSAIHAIFENGELPARLNDQYSNGQSGPLADICPFTTIGLFNRGILVESRKKIAKSLAEFLEVSTPVPDSFDAIPVLNQFKTWFFTKYKDRRPEDIDNLWDVFAQALAFADNEGEEAQQAFIKAYDMAITGHNVKWNLTMGLYWVRPWNYPTLDENSRQFIEDKLQIKISKTDISQLKTPAKICCSGTDYLNVRENLLELFNNQDSKFHSFPQLSLAAWQKDNTKALMQFDKDSKKIQNVNHDNKENNQPLINAYSIDDIIDDGCFIDRDKLKKILIRLEFKKNLILQGPPGTGKTWLAKRLAYALIGYQKRDNIRTVQFHPNLSYEDFIRGWRPTGEGKLNLVNGPFLEMINVAKKNPLQKFVMVIEEINRGNPTQILGEMLTLLEADKRSPAEALELSYKKEEDERVYIPENLYVIGTMNIADRSVALVDLALRRRFAFIDLEPVLGKSWRQWVQDKCGIDEEILRLIENRLNTLNEQISNDISLGRQFRIGHSYVTPPSGAQIEDAKDWFYEVVETEISPLLDEYWFDAAAKARDAKKQLQDGLGVKGDVG